MFRVSGFVVCSAYFGAFACFLASLVLSATWVLPVCLVFFGVCGLVVLILLVGIWFGAFACFVV